MIQNDLLKKLSRNMVADPTNYMSSFRRNLLMYIERKEISLDDIAEDADISRETLKTLAYGKAGDCKLSTAVSLARALKVSVDELVGAGTISPTMCESIQITRNLPDNYVFFVRWIIRYQERMLAQKKVSAKAINVMNPECSKNGNLAMNNNYTLVDISSLESFIRYKTFMGIKIPCEHYMPALSKGDILLLAFDRMPLQDEMVVALTNGYIRIMRHHEEPNNEITYRSIITGKTIATSNEIEEIIGYVTKVVNEGLIE